MKDKMCMIDMLCRFSFNVVYRRCVFFFLVNVCLNVHFEYCLIVSLFISVTSEV